MLHHTPGLQGGKEVLPPIIGYKKQQVEDAVKQLA